MKYKVGDTVAVINSTMGGRFFVESEAAIVREIPRRSDEQYVVAIKGDRVYRFILAQAQTDPHSYVAKLNAAGGAQ